MGQLENKNDKCLINEVWQPHERFRVVTTKAFHFRSADWTIIEVDLLDTSQDVTINHTELDSEYFVFEDTAHTALEIEVAPTIIKGGIIHLILLVRFPQPPFCLGKSSPSPFPFPGLASSVRT